VISLELFKYQLTKSQHRKSSDEGRPVGRQQGSNQVVENAEERECRPTGEIHQRTQPGFVHVGRNLLHAGRLEEAARLQEAVNDLVLLHEQVLQPGGGLLLILGHLLKGNTPHQQVGFHALSMQQAQHCGRYLKI